MQEQQGLCLLYEGLPNSIFELLILTAAGHVATYRGTTTLMARSIGRSCNTDLRTIVSSYCYQYPRQRTYGAMMIDAFAQRTAGPVLAVERAKHGRSSPIRSACVPVNSITLCSAYLFGAAYKSSCRNTQNLLDVRSNVEPRVVNVPVLRYC